MKQHGFIAKPFEIKGLLEDRITMISRPVKPQPQVDDLCVFPDGQLVSIMPTDGSYVGTRPCPKKGWLTAPYQPGDVFYVRETWQTTDNLGIHPADENAGFIYKESENGKDWEEGSEEWDWCPSATMPKEAARIWLLVESVTCQRVQDVNSEQAEAHGVDKLPLDDLGNTFKTFKRGFQAMYESLYGTDSYERNEYIWTYKIKVLSTTGMPDNQK